MKEKTETPSGGATEEPGFARPLALALRGWLVRTPFLDGRVIRFRGSAPRYRDRAWVFDVEVEGRRYAVRVSEAAP